MANAHLKGSVLQNLHYKAHVFQTNLHFLNRQLKCVANYFNIYWLYTKYWYLNCMYFYIEREKLRANLICLDQGCLSRVWSKSESFFIEDLIRIRFFVAGLIRIRFFSRVWDGSSFFEDLCEYGSFSRVGSGKSGPGFASCEGGRILYLLVKKSFSKFQGSDSFWRSKPWYLY